MKRNRGMSIMEYATLVGAVSLAVAAMSVYVQRAMKANLQNVEDEFTAQQPKGAEPPPPDDGKLGFSTKPQPHTDPVFRDPFSIKAEGE